MSSGGPLVSAIIPTYNRADVLSRAVESVLRQTFDDIELVIIDDCSTDSTEESVREYILDSKVDIDIAYERHDRNRGAPAARNTGARIATGEYLAFLDSDDVWLPEKTEEQVRCAEDEGRDVVYCDVRLVESDGKRIWNCPGKRGDIYRDQLLRDQVPRTSAVLISKNAFDAVGGFDADLPARQDYELWLRLARHFSFGYVSRPLVEANITRDDRISENVDVQLCAHEKIGDILEGHLRDEPWYFKRRVYSSHELILGEYLYSRNKRELASKHLKRSIFKNPMNMKSFGLLLLVCAGIPPDSDIISGIKRVTNFLQ